MKFRRVYILLRITFWIDREAEGKIKIKVKRKGKIGKHEKVGVKRKW